MIKLCRLNATIDSILLIIEIHDRLLRYLDKVQERNCKEIQLQTHINFKQKKYFVCISKYPSLAKTK